MKQLPNIEQKTSHHYNGEPVEPASTGKYQYFWLVREKKSHSWEAVAYFNVAGDSCTAAAESHFHAHGYKIWTGHNSLARIADQREWEQFKTTIEKKKLSKVNRNVSK